MGYFILKKDNDGFYAFTLNSGDGNILLRSENYESKDEAENGIEMMRTIASFSSRFHQKRTLDDHFYFVVMAANDQIVGTSIEYASLASAEIDVEAVKQCAPTANVVDETMA